MFEPVKKIVLLCSLAAGITLFSAAVAQAQKIEAEVLSAAEFAEKYGGGKYADALKKRNKPTIVCGNETTICDIETEICLKGAWREGTNVVRGGKNADVSYTSDAKMLGKCVAKNGFDEKNLHKYFEGTSCKKKGEGNSLSSTSWYTACTISITTENWLIEDVYTLKGVTTSSSEYTFSDGDKNYKLVMSENPTVVYAENGSDNAFNGCEVLPVKIYNMQGCFFCPLAGLVYSMANDVTSNAFDYFSASFRVVIVVIFALWLALAALGHVFSMTKQDAPKFLAAILKQGFKVMFAFALLVYANDLFRYFVVPLLDSGLKLGVGIQTVSMPQPTNYTKTDITTGNRFYNIHTKGKTSLYDRIELYLAAVQARLTYMQAIGTTVFCVGSHKITFWQLVKELSEFKAGLRMMFLGGILVAFSFLLTMAFAFYFVDAILQLAVIGVMMPFMIAGWPFKATAQYAGTGFKMLLNTFFVLFFTGFVVSVNTELINQSLSLSQSQNAETEIQARTSEGFQTIVSAINDQNFEALNKATNIGGAGFLLLAFCCIFGFKFITQVTPLASKLSAGGFGKGGIASKIGTMAASATKGMATKAAKPVGRALGGMAMDGAVGVVGLPGQALGAISGGLQTAGDKLAEKGHGKLAATAKGIGAVSKFGGKVGSLPHKAVKAVRDEAKSKQ